MSLHIMELRRGLRVEGLPRLMALLAISGVLGLILHVFEVLVGLKREWA